jgi:hypothetical protein
LRSAYRARPPARTSTGLPRSARVSSDRGGCPLDPGDGGAPPEPSGVPGRRLPLPSGQSLNPSSNNPSTGVHFTRHQRGFKQFTRPAISPRLRRPDGTSRRLGFPPGFAPRRPGADNARQGGDRPPSTDLELHAQHHISRSSNRVAHSQRATSCRNASSAHALLAGRRRATANGGGIDPTRAAHEAAPVGPVDPGASLPLDPDPAV